MKKEDIRKYLTSTVDGLTHLVPLSDEALEDFYKIAVTHFYTKGKSIIHIGEVVTGIHFMVKGLAGSFTFQGKNKFTTSIVHESEFFTNYKSYAQCLPSIEGTVALEDGFGFFFPKAMLLELIQKHYSVAILIIKLNEINFVKLYDRIFELKYKSAEERFDSFNADFPDIFNRMTLKDIAAYLNMAPETLSRIKKKRLEFFLC